MLESEFWKVILNRRERSEIGIIGENRRFPIAMLESQNDDRDVFRLYAGNSGEEPGVNVRSTFVE